LCVLYGVMNVVLSAGGAGGGGDALAGGRRRCCVCAHSADNQAATERGGLLAPYRHLGVHDSRLDKEKKEGLVLSD
jgi:hypothetical protein